MYFQDAVRTPTISVVIPVYNAAEFIGEALDSVFAQTCLPLEVIVVDDGSEDRTPDVVASYASKVTYIRKERGGPGSARNVGIRAASGQWIAFLDGDDIWLPTLLEKLARVASQTQASLVFCDSQQLINGSASDTSRLESYGLKKRLRTLAPNGVMLDPFRLFLEERCYIFTPGAMIEREALVDVGLFDETFYCGEDLDLWLRLSMHYRFAVIGEVLHLRRIHGKNTGYNWWAKVRGDLQVYEKIGQYAPQTRQNPALKKLVGKKLAHTYRDLGALNMGRADRAAARTSWATSLHYSFSVPVAGNWLITFVPSSWIRAALNLRKRIKSAIRLPGASCHEIASSTMAPIRATEDKSETAV
jgi:glycosyltransferase involved in cell wall biosynthesis